jgi:hypothetical protein
MHMFDTNSAAGEHAVNLDGFWGRFYFIYIRCFSLQAECGGGQKKL